MILEIPYISKSKLVNKPNFGVIFLRKCLTNHILHYKERAVHHNNTKVKAKQNDNTPTILFV